MTATDTSGIDPAALKNAVDSALTGSTNDLFELLSANGGTDRGTVNMALAEEFAREAAKRGAAGDALSESMAGMSRVKAPADSPQEFLTVCGVIALGERAARAADRIDAVIAILDRVANDKRERVQSAADEAMTKLVAGHGPKLLEHLGSADVDSFVVTALGRPHCLDTFTSPDPILTKLDKLFQQLATSPPLLDTIKTWDRTRKVLEWAPAAIAKKFPEAIAELLTKWSTDTGKRIPPIIAANRKLLDAK